MKLVLAEKPSVAQSIAKVLGAVHLRSPEIFGYVYEVPLYG